MNKTEPLASRMRPKSLKDYYGQSHILSEGMLLRRSIDADRIPSMILYGPPGTGKTSLASVIASTTGARWIRINATTSGKKDMEDAVRQAHEATRQGLSTILFIDEIHRFNKAQQDFLLSHVESGDVILIGATTENPYFEVNKALVSRCHIFELKPLSTEEIESLIGAAVEYMSNSEDYPQVSIEDDAKKFLSEMAAGDARHAYNAVEIAALSTAPDANNSVSITLDIAKDSIQKKVSYYDKDGDSHYDTISAFIKSMRGSDPDATLYYLARMLYSGEDIRYIARRIMIHACEDVGLANPHAIVVAEACCSAVERIGMPEAQILLSEAALYVAMSPKSNSACASIERAMQLMKVASNLDIPAHLRDSHYKGAKELNRGIGYDYPHDHDISWCEQQYMPERLSGVELYLKRPNDLPGYADKFKKEDDKK